MRCMDSVADLKAEMGEGEATLEARWGIMTNF